MRELVNNIYIYISNLITIVLSLLGRNEGEAVFSSVSVIEKPGILLVCIQASQPGNRLYAGQELSIRFAVLRNAASSYLLHVCGSESELVRASRRARSHRNLHDRRIEFRILYLARRSSSTSSVATEIRPQLRNL